MMNNSTITNIYKKYDKLLFILVFLLFGFGCVSGGYLFRSNFVLQMPIQITLQLPFRKIGTESALLVPKVYAQEAGQSAKLEQAIIPSEVDMFNADQVKAYVKQETIREFGEDQWKFVELLLEGESGFNPYAFNSSSGACGLFQSLPCIKYGTKGLDLENQVVWGIAYIRRSYTNPQNAYTKWAQRSPHWY